MQGYYLEMYLNDKLIDSVPLNYSGLQSPEEKGWYHQGMINNLCERHEALLRFMGLPPVFLIGDEFKTPMTGLLGKHSRDSSVFL